MIKAIVTAYKRWSLTRDCHFWGERIEQLERRRITFQADMEHALDMAAKSKRELVLLDVTHAKITHAPGRGPRDGVARFTLTDDSPHTAIARKRELRKLVDVKGSL